MECSWRKRPRTLQDPGCGLPFQPQQQQDAQQHGHCRVEGGHYLLQQLPEALLSQIVLQGGTQRHLHGVLAAVCQDWRRVLLENTTQLAVGLTSARGAASLATWLAQHAAGLEELNMATIGLFGRHCDNATRLQLFQALHEAVTPRGGGPTPANIAADAFGGAAAAAPGVAAASVSAEHGIAPAAAADAATPTAAFGRLGLEVGNLPRDCSPRSAQQPDREDVSDGTWSDSSSEAAGESHSEPRTPRCLGGMLAGTDHVVSPSPTGQLLAAAAAAAAFAEEAQMDVEVGAVTQCTAAAQHPGHRAAAAATAACVQHSPEQPGPLLEGLHAAVQLQPQPRELQLRQLSANMRLTPADCAAIAALPAPHLSRLELQGSRTRRLGIDGVRALAVLTQLTCLKMQQLGIGDDATVLLAAGLPGLLELHLPGNNMGPAGAAAIAQHCTKLEVLDLSINRVKAAGLTALCGALHYLRELHLAGNPGLDATSLQQLQQLTRVSHLTISSSGLCNQGLAAIAAALTSQLQVLDAGNNRVSKVDALTGLVSLHSLNLSRNPLQLNASRVLAGLQLQSLSVFDAAPPRSTAHLAGRTLAAQLTALTLGSDPSANAEDSDESLALEKTRTCSTLFGVLADAGRLQVLSVPCTGLGDAQGRMLAKLGATLRVLNVSYNCLTPVGLRVLRDLTHLERLELRAMRPELTDDVTSSLCCCTRLSHLDLAHNDLTSEGVKHLGCPALFRLQHLDLRNNAQVEKWAVLAAAAHLRGLTHLNLLEISDVSARAYPRPSKPSVKGGPAGLLGQAASPSPPWMEASPARMGAAAGAGGAGVPSPPASSRAGAAGTAAVGVHSSCAAGQPHADVWAALPDLEELLVEGQYAPNVGRGGRVMVSTS